MKAAIKLLYILIFSNILGITTAAGQSVEKNSIVREDLNIMFEHLDKSKVPTGILLDYGMDLVDFDKYDGYTVCDSNYVDSETFVSILQSVSSSRVHGDDINLDYVIPEFSRYVMADRQDVGIVVFKYNYIKANALEDNLIKYTSGQVYDVYENGIWNNPYGEAFVFGFSPEANISETGSVEYRFSTQFIFKNTDIAKIEFDAGDGKGFSVVNCPATVNAVYTSDGIKELKLKLTLSDGEQLTAHSFIYANTQKYCQSSDSDIPDEKWTKTTNYNGTTVSAGITVKYSPGHSSITKPFILVEGFDPWRLQSILQKNDEADANTTPETGFTTFNGAYEVLTSYFKDNFDIIYIDWYNSEADIRANAQLLEEIILEINLRKAQTGSKGKNLILAQSMGGLIARYALCSMERRGVSHETDTFISHDSPHLGANIPLGMLYALHQTFSLYAGHPTAFSIADWLIKSTDINGSMKLFSDILYSDAVRQMLIYYVDMEGLIDDDGYDDLHNELRAMGFPKGDLNSSIDNLAIVNGNNFDQTSTLNAIGNHYIYISGYAKASFLADLCATLIAQTIGSPLIIFLTAIKEAELIPALFIGSTRLDILLEVNPFFNRGDKLSELDITYTKKFLWIFPKTYTIFSDVKYGSGQPMDGYPGSIYNLSNIIGNGKGYIDITDSGKGWGGKYGYSFRMTDKFMFIPTASALCIGNGSSMPNDAKCRRNYYDNPPSYPDECPFTGLYLYESASDHININQNVYDWLETQLQMKIVGNDRAHDGEQYSVTGIPGPVRWSSLNENAATIDAETGIITGVNGGNTTIMAEYYIGGERYAKTKDIMVNFAPIVLDCEYRDDIGYYVVARTSEWTYTEQMLEWAENGYITYRWGIKDSDGDIRWTESDRNFIIIGPPEREENIAVFLQISDTSGYTSKTYFYEANIGYIYDLGYDCVIIDKSRQAFFIKNIGADIGYPKHEYYVYQRALKLFDSEQTPTTSDVTAGDSDYYLEIAGSGISLPSTHTLLNGDYHVWAFDLFNSEPFLENLSDFINRDDLEDNETAEMKLILKRKSGTMIQIMHFPIIYRSDYIPVAIAPSEPYDPHPNPGDQFIPTYPIVN